MDADTKAARSEYWWDVGRHDGKSAAAGILGDGESRYRGVNFMGSEFKKTLKRIRDQKDPDFSIDLLTEWFEPVFDHLSSWEDEDSLFPPADFFGSGSRAHDEHTNAVISYRMGFTYGYSWYVADKHNLPVWGEY